MTVRLQVKYCYSEDEVNKFLMKLSTTEYPKVQSIQYCGKVQGEGTDQSVSVGSDVVAIVQYFIDSDAKSTERVKK